MVESMKTFLEFMLINYVFCKIFGEMLEKITAIAGRIFINKYLKNLLEKCHNQIT